MGRLVVGIELQAKASEFDGGIGIASLNVRANEFLERLIVVIGQVHSFREDPLFVIAFQ